MASSLLTRRDVVTLCADFCRGINFLHLHYRTSISITLTACRTSQVYSLYGHSEYGSGTGFLEGTG
ncbi:MAG: hypothetical protein Q4G68_00290 [Planctomycetia bacterium]|nr:hypothetical protein [Planctomycetia bacterium]